MDWSAVAVILMGAWGGSGTLVLVFFGINSRRIAALEGRIQATDRRISETREEFVKEDHFDRRMDALNADNKAMALKIGELDRFLRERLLPRGSEGGKKDR